VIDGAAPVFFWISKLAWMVISPGNLLVLLVLAGWICLGFKWHMLGRRLISLAALLMLLIAFLPLGEWLIAPLEKRFPTNPPLPEQVDGIIVLGGSVDPYLSSLWQQPQLNGSADRLAAFLDLSARYPTARQVFTGGSGSLTQQEFKEASIANDVFYQLGYVNHAVIFESESRNTYENAVNSKELLQPQPGETWILITSASHMPRSMAVFCAQDWRVLPYPVDHSSQPGNLLRIEFSMLEHLSQLDLALKEWVGLVAYRFSGRTERLLPAVDAQCANS
jgi:uncharacterized SAM-binding protein YcdF (DUF218 family)